MSATDPAEVPLLVSTDRQQDPTRATDPSGLERRPGRRPRQGLGHSLVANRKALTGMIILALFVVVALLAPLLAPGNPSTITPMKLSAPSAQRAAIVCPPRPLTCMCVSAPLTASNPVAMMITSNSSSPSAVFRPVSVNRSMGFASR